MNEPDHMKLHNRKFRFQEEKTIPFDAPPHTDFQIYGTDGLFINLATCDSKEKAERVVAAMNSLAGIPDPEAVLKMVREALEKVEWRWAPEYGYHVCPVCLNPKRAGHEENCSTAVALLALTPAQKDTR